MKKSTLFFLFIVCCLGAKAQFLQEGLTFDGIDDQATIPHHSAYDLGTGDFTFEALIQASSSQTGIPVILSNRGVGTSGFLLMLYNGAFALQVGSFNYLTVGNNLYDNTCHHIACTRQDSILTFYLDGNILAQDPGNSLTAPYDISNSHDLWMGLDFQNPNTKYHGLIHELRMWNIARTQSEIQTNSAIYLGGSEPGLIGYWRMNEGTGQIINDYSVNLNNGVLGTTANVEIVDPTYVAGCPIVNAHLATTGLLFDGMDDRVTVPHHTAYDLGSGDFTFEALIQANSVQTGIPVILSNRGVGLSGFLVMLYNGGLAMQVGSFNYLTTGNNLFDNACHHVACTRASNILTFYLDGNVLSQDLGNSLTAPYDISNSHDLWMGLDFQNASTKYHGLIHEVRMWNVARTQSQIQSAMNQYISGNRPGLIGYWRMNEGSGQTIYDLSVNLNNGVLGATSNLETSDPSFTTGCYLITGQPGEIPDTKQNLVVFPNPSSSTITLSIVAQETASFKVEIFDSQSVELRMMKIVPVSNGSQLINVDVSHFAAGVYFVRVTGKQFSVIKKFCKF